LGNWYLDNFWTPHASISTILQIALITWLKLSCLDVGVNNFHVLSLELGGADKYFAVHESETTLPPSWALQFLDVECLDTN